MVWGIFLFLSVSISLSLSDAKLTLSYNQLWQRHVLDVAVHY